MDLKNDKSIVTEADTNVQTSVEGKINPKRRIAPLLFGLTFLFFFFNFFTISCNKEEFVSLKGIDLVVGKALSDSKPSSENDRGMRISPNIWAILAFGSAVVGLSLFLFLKNKNKSMIAALVGAIGFISLIVLRVSFSSSASEQGTNVPEMEIKTHLAYWLALFAMIAATVFSFLYADRGVGKKTNSEENN